jgi:hypothetical protein
MRQRFRILAILALVGIASPALAWHKHHYTTTVTTGVVSTAAVVPGVTQVIAPVQVTSLPVVSGVATVSTPVVSGVTTVSSPVMTGLNLMSTPVLLVNAAASPNTTSLVTTGSPISGNPQGPDRSPGGGTPPPGSGDTAAMRQELAKMREELASFHSDVKTEMAGIRRGIEALATPRAPDASSQQILDEIKKMRADLQALTGRVDTIEKSKK